MFLCASASQPPSSSSLDRGSGLQQDLLMRVFSRSLWVDDETTSLPSDTPSGLSAGSQHPTWNWLQTQLAPPSSSSSSSSSTAGLQVPSSAPVGSWLSLVSVYTSSLDSVMGMATFWQECLEEVRVHWENKVPIPRLFPPVPIIQSEKKDQNQDQDQDESEGEGEGKGDVDVDIEDDDDDETSGDFIKSEVAQGIWLEPLWEDLQVKSKKTATPFELPDLQQNLPHQKLQMVNMCILCGDVPSTIREAQGVQYVTKARQQLTDELKQLHKQLQGQGLSGETGEHEGQHQHRASEMDEDEQVDARSNNVDRDGDGDGDRDSHVSDVTSTLTANKASLRDLLSMDVASRDLSHITPPRLQRRLPMTSDALAQHRHLANKLRLGSSRSASENTMLRWQILYPELISDVRAFKGCNNTVPSSHDGHNSSISSNESSSSGRNINSNDEKTSGGCNEPVVTFEDFVVWYGGAGVSLPTPHQQHEQEEEQEKTGPQLPGRGGKGVGEGGAGSLQARGLDEITLEDLRVSER